VRYILSWPSRQLLSARKYTVSYRIIHCDVKSTFLSPAWVLLHIHGMSFTSSTEAWLLLQQNVAGTAVTGRWQRTWKLATACQKKRLQLSCSNFAECNTELQFSVYMLLFWPKMWFMQGRLTRNCWRISSCFVLSLVLFLFSFSVYFLSFFYNSEWIWI